MAIEGAFSVRDILIGENEVRSLKDCGVGVGFLCKIVAVVAVEG